MKLNLLQPFENMPYFTIEGFRQVTGMQNPEQVRMLLYRWANSGHIVPIRKGIYMHRRFFDLHGGDASLPAAISAILLPLSYLSCEFVLQRHALLTDVTYPITSITTKNTRRITNRIGTFWYRHIKTDLYHGFTLSEYFGIRIAEARLPKALFDYLYMRVIPAAFRSQGFNLAEELRLDLAELTSADREEFVWYVEESGSLKMRQIHNNFRSNIWQP